MTNQSWEWDAQAALVERKVPRNITSASTILDALEGTNFTTTDIERIIKERLGVESVDLTT